MKHDGGDTFDGKICGIPGKTIMTAATGGGIWSKCSQREFEAHYLENKNHWCMPEMSNACTAMALGKCPKPLPDPSQTAFKHIGCYKNGVEGNYKGISGNWQVSNWPIFLRYNFPNALSVDSCYNEVKNSGKQYKTFAIQHQTSCFASLNATIDPSYKTSTECVCGTGDNGVVDVYEVVTMDQPGRLLSRIIF